MKTFFLPMMQRARIHINQEPRSFLRLLFRVSLMMIGNIQHLMMERLVTIQDASSSCLGSALVEGMKHYEPRKELINGYSCVSTAAAPFELNGITPGYTTLPTCKRSASGGSDSFSSKKTRGRKCKYFLLANTLWHCS